MIKMPRVSVVIINWNYGRYVGQAIQSVKDQTYQNLECIIVDNGSDDESVDVIADAIRNHPEFTLHTLPRNLGQLGGSLFSLRHVRDRYFTPILHRITGTNLIDRLLNAYRVHGANDFTMLPGLVGLNSSYGQAESR